MSTPDLLCDKEDCPDDIVKQELGMDSWRPICKIGGASNRIVNRIGDPKKQRFIAAFVADKRIDDYPVVESDALDENQRGREFYERGVHAALTEEVQRAYELTGETGPSASVVATDLLDSDYGEQKGVLFDIPMHEVSVPVVLAHVEALDLGFSPRLAASVARRATMVLLNRRLTAAA